MSQTEPGEESEQRSLFRNRAFLHYWSGRVLSMSAYQMQVVATGWSVYDLTGSALDLGYVGLAQFLPRILLTPWAGAAADRLDRRSIACVCTLVQFIACTLLAYHSWQGSLTRELIFGLISALGAARSFEMPTMQSLLPNIVPSELFARALAMSTAATQIAIIGGPALAGVIFIASATAVYASAAAMFLCACLIMFSMKPVHRVTPTRSSSNSLWAGLHSSFKSPSYWELFRWTCSPYCSVARRPPADLRQGHIACQRYWPGTLASVTSCRRTSHDGLSRTIPIVIQHRT